MIIQSLIGIVALILIAIPFSESIQKIKVKFIIYALLIQTSLAFILLEIPFISSFFDVMSMAVESLRLSAIEGSSFVFGYLGGGDAPFEVSNNQNLPIFAFTFLPMLIFLSALSALLWHWKILPFLIKLLAKLFEKPLDAKGPIGLAATANIFLGQLEAPLLIKPYLNKMNQRDLLIIMTVGMSTIAGSVMVLYITWLDDKFTGVIGHFLTASILSVPAAIMFSNILIPSAQTELKKDKEDLKMYESSMDAISVGTKDGLNMFLSVIASLIVFLSLVALADFILGIFPNVYGEPISLQRIAAFIFAPIAWLMGIPFAEIIPAGNLLGTKTIFNELIAFNDLRDLDTNVLSERSQLIMLYGICGFANISSVGILLGGLSAICPDIRGTLLKIAFRALFAATLASCLTGTVVSLFI
nr:MAG: nucleoside:proton symporter [Gammaproteobacteria bacterium]